MITNTIKINIRDNCVTEKDAIARIKDIMSWDRISNNNTSYCRCAKYKDGIIVFSNKKKYDVFDIYKESHYDSKNL